MFQYLSSNKSELQVRHFGGKWRHRFNGVFNGFLITRDGVGRLATRQRMSQRLFIVTTLLERGNNAAEKY